MNYIPSPVLAMEQIKKNIESKDKAIIIDGLLSIFMNDIDKDYAIILSKWAMSSDDIDLKKIGIIGMGHVARVYGLSDLSEFKSNIDTILKSNDQELLSILQDAIDDFQTFKR